MTVPSLFPSPIPVSFPDKCAPLTQMTRPLNGYAPVCVRSDAEQLQRQQAKPDRKPGLPFFGGSNDQVTPMDDGTSNHALPAKYIFMLKDKK